MSGSKTNTMTLEAVKGVVDALPEGSDFTWDGVDEDDRPATEAEMRAAIELDRARREAGGKSGKTPVVLAVDSDVLEAFQAAGPDWRARMNEALRAWTRAGS